MLTCRQCRRANPEEACYCWYDGVHLDSPRRAASSWADAAGVKRFAPPLVLRSGTSIATFADLVRLAGAHWDDLLVALRDGSLERTFRQVQRADLADRAAWAARHVDPEQALDELLERLPGTKREPARLEIAPLEIDLGAINRATPRTLTLHLTNRGQGLLQGTIHVEGAAWLSLADVGGVQKKLIRCPRELSIPVRVVGKALRSGSKPLEGKIVVETNGGTFEIPVRAMVPVVPFGEGILAGATTPGQLAEKARTSPREAAALFERGLVVAWYEANGWIYPVRGPLAEGIGAVQQFFEALGRATPPQVSISETVIELRGTPGESLQSRIVLSTKEPRPVYGHGVSQADWLEVGRPSLDGQRAILPLRVRSVPDRPNEQLRTRVEVGANGGQKFQVEVVLHVLPGAARKPTPSTQEAPSWLFAEPTTTPQPVPVPVSAPTPVPVPTPTRREPAPMRVIPIPEPVPIPQPEPAMPAYLNARPAPAPTPAPKAHPAPAEDVSDPTESSIPPWLRMLLPLLFLCLALGGLLLHDVLLPNRLDEQPPEFVEGPLDPVEYVRIGFNDQKRDNLPVVVNMTFGLAMSQEPDPRAPGGFKLLTYDPFGRTNNTCLQVDGKQTLFGTFGGKWIVQNEALPRPSPEAPSPGRRSVWRTLDGDIDITQDVELIRGDLSRKLDTCLVRYTLTNRDSRRHEVGLRFLLDTFIGANDGVPFTIPGSPDLCDTQRDFKTAREVPDYLEALEKEDLAHPGTVAHLRLRLGKQIEPPGRVTLGHWPNQRLSRLPGHRGLLVRDHMTLWDVPVLPMKALAESNIRWEDGKKIPPDSAVTLYWEPRPLEPGQSRVVGFTYGLGQASSGESKGKMLLTVGGRLVRDSEFTLTALVSHPAPGETLTLELPAGLQVRSGTEQQAVPPVPPDSTRPISTLTWKLIATKAGVYTVKVRSSRGAAETKTITIGSSGVFD